MNSRASRANARSINSSKTDNRIAFGFEPSMRGFTDLSLVRSFAGRRTIAIRIQFTHKPGIHLHETKEFFMTVIRTLGLLILFTIVGFIESCLKINFLYSLFISKLA